MSKLITCLSCGHTVFRDSNRCPHCNAKPSVNPTRETGARSLRTGFVIALIAALCVAGFTAYLDAAQAERDLIARAQAAERERIEREAAEARKLAQQIAEVEALQRRQEAICSFFPVLVAMSRDGALLGVVIRTARSQSTGWDRRTAGLAAVERGEPYMTRALMSHLRRSRSTLRYFESMGLSAVISEAISDGKFEDADFRPCAM